GRSGGVARRPLPGPAAGRGASRLRAATHAARAPRDAPRSRPRRRLSHPGSPPCRRADARPRAAAPGAADADPGASRGTDDPAGRSARAWRSHPARTGEGRGRRGAASRAEDDRVDATIAGPARFALLLAERQLLPVADGRHAIRRDTLSRQVVLHRLGSLRAECEVVLDRATAVAVALELHLRARVLPEPVDVAGEHVARRPAELVAVVGEVPVTEDAAPPRSEAALGALQPRAAEAFLSQPRRPRTAFTRPHALLLASAPQGDDQDEGQRN